MTNRLPDLPRLDDSVRAEWNAQGARITAAGSSCDGPVRKRKLATLESRVRLHRNAPVETVASPILAIHFAFLLSATALITFWEIGGAGMSQRSLTALLPPATCFTIASFALAMLRTPTRAGRPSPFKLFLLSALLAMTSAIVVSFMTESQVTNLFILYSILLTLGVNMFMRMPSLALCYTLAAGATLLLTTNRMNFTTASVVAASAFIAFAIAYSNRKEAMARFLELRHLSDRARTSEELIAGFEESGNHWLWEVDAECRFRYVSPRLAILLNQDVQSVVGQEVSELFGTYARSSDKQSPLHTLQFYMSARLAFHDIVLPLRVDGTERWLSLSGGPLSDAIGQFAGFSGVGTDLTSTRQVEEQARKLALFDGLTGLANRVHFTELLDDLLARSAGRHSPCTLMFIDLDRFKMVNDTLGHPVGDKLLEEVARRIEHVLKGQGRAGRIGGDEFVVALQDSPRRREIAALAERLIAEISAPYHIGRSKIQIGASIGLATSPEHGKTSEELIRNADLALYRSKSSGRGTYHFYEPYLGTTAENRRLLELDLREALAADQLSLHYQPIFELQSGKLVGFEALLRWTHPVRGDVSPEEFVPIAEESGLILQVGDWVIRTALCAAAEWPDHVRIAINLSPIQLQDPGLSLKIVNALAACQVHPDRLELEITESVFLQETDAIQDNLTRLKKLGVRFSLDDFGTGYSSLGYLRRGLFDKVKIDRSFVHGVEFRGSGDRSIVKAVVALAQSLRMTSTAEGAETEKQLNALREIGCNEVQGFAAGKPLDHDSAGYLARSAAAASDERVFEPRAHRLAMLKNIHLEVEGRTVRAVLRNISSGGAMVTTEEPLSLGDRAQLELPAIGRPVGMVRWTQGRRTGLEFERHVELEPLRQLQMNEAHLKPTTSDPSSPASEAA